MNRGKPYTTKEVEAIKRDYIGGMCIDNIAEKYGRSISGVKMKLSTMGVRRVRPSKYKKNPGEAMERKSRYQYAIVTADEYELPLTPYVNSIRELSRLIDNITYNGLLQHRMRVKRGMPMRGIRMYVGGQFVWGKIVQIDTEDEDE